MTKVIRGVKRKTFGSVITSRKMVRGKVYRIDHRTVVYKANVCVLLKKFMYVVSIDKESNNKLKTNHILFRLFS